MSHQYHDDWLEEIIAMAAGELDSYEAEPLNAHLLTCPACSQKLQQYQQVAHDLAMLKEEIHNVPLPPEMITLQRQIAGQPSLETLPSKKERMLALVKAEGAIIEAIDHNENNKGRDEIIIQTLPAPQTSLEKSKRDYALLSIIVPTLLLSFVVSIGAIIIVLFHLGGAVSLTGWFMVAFAILPYSIVTSNKNRLKRLQIRTILWKLEIGRRPDGVYWNFYLPALSALFHRNSRK